MYEGLEQRPIICLDMRSFYVSCSVIGHGLDPMEACIAVIGNQERWGIPVEPRRKNIHAAELVRAAKWETRRLGAAMDKLRQKYGPTAVLRAVSYTDAGTAVGRASPFGGHKADGSPFPAKD